MRLALTFDDSFLNEWGRAHVILRDLGFKATFFINDVDHIAEQEGGINCLRSMQAAGHEIGHHTIHHQCVRNWVLVDKKDPEDWYKLEIADSFQHWEKVGFQPNVFSYPFGTLDDYLSEKLKEHYVAQRGYVIGREIFNSTLPSHVIPALALDDTESKFNEIMEILDEHRKMDKDLVMVGHEIDDKPAEWVTSLDQLATILNYCKEHNIELVHFSEMVK